MDEFYIEFAVDGSQPKYVHVIEDDLKVLKGSPLHESDYEDIERQLMELFHNVIFKPIIDLLAPKNAQVKAAARELKNSKMTLSNAKFDPIVAGINSGKIQYVADTFSGDFNATISKALRSYGAKWNRRDSTFTILLQQLPKEVVAAASHYNDTAKALHDDLAKRLDAIEASLSGTIDKAQINAHKTVEKFDKKFDKAYGDALSLEQLSDEAKKKLADKYADNIKPYVKKFSSEMIAELREMVSVNAKAGYRFDSLVDRIQNRYAVTTSKATFLARQETAIFTATARETRFGDSGITSYVWRTAGDGEVRKDHKKLNGRTFSYDDPPVVDEASGRRGNPGSGDFNCRCVDEPILPKMFAEAA